MGSDHSRCGRRDWRQLAQDDLVDAIHLPCNADLECLMHVKIDRRVYQVSDREDVSVLRGEATVVLPTCGG